MSGGDQFFEPDPTDYEEYWDAVSDNPEQFAQQQLAPGQLSMSFTEPGIQTNQYVPDTAALSNQYILPNQEWLYQPHPMEWQQPIQYPFPQNNVPPFDFEVSQPEIFEPIPMTHLVPDQYVLGESQAQQAAQRRHSLQPLQPQNLSGDTRARSASLATPGRSSPSDTTQRDIISRTASPGAAEPEQYGYPVDDGSWKCSYPQCKSTTVFRRACDLRKHYKRHFKRYFCSYRNCQHHTSGGFSSKKDCDRHEASHNPSIPCSHPGCPRIFSRVDNMRDHVKRTHGGPPPRTRRGTS